MYKFLFEFQIEMFRGEGSEWAVERMRDLFDFIEMDDNEMLMDAAARRRASLRREDRVAAAAAAAREEERERQLAVTEGECRKLREEMERLKVAVVEQERDRAVMAPWGGVLMWQLLEQVVALERRLVQTQEANAQREAELREFIRRMQTTPRPATAGAVGDGAAAATDLRREISDMIKTLETLKRGK
jgi:hypothetical protein